MCNGLAKFGARGREGVNNTRGGRVDWEKGVGGVLTCLAKQFLKRMGQNERVRMLAS